MLQDANRVLKRKVSDSATVNLPRKLYTCSLGPHDSLDHSQEQIIQLLSSEETLSASDKSDAQAQIGRSVGPPGGRCSIKWAFGLLLAMHRHHHTFKWSLPALAIQAAASAQRQHSSSLFFALCLMVSSSQDCSCFQLDEVEAEAPPPPQLPWQGGSGDAMLSDGPTQPEHFFQALESNPSLHPTYFLLPSISCLNK